MVLLLPFVLLSGANFIKGGLSAVERWFGRASASSSPKGLWCTAGFARFAKGVSIRLIYQKLEEVFDLEIVLYTHSPRS